MPKLKQSVSVAITVIIVTAPSYGWAQQGTTDKEPRVTVCELLANMQKWNGRLVEVEGTFRSGTLYIWDSCPTAITVKGHTFQNVIALADPSVRGVAVHKIPFQRDEASWARFIEATYSEALSGNSLVVTVVGVFETRLDVEQLIRGDGLPWGFGEQNMAPAQLVVREVRDLKLVH